MASSSSLPSSPSCVILCCLADSLFLWEWDARPIRIGFQKETHRKPLSLSFVFSASLGRRIELNCVRLASVCLFGKMGWVTHRSLLHCWLVRASALRAHTRNYAVGIFWPPDRRCRSMMTTMMMMIIVMTMTTQLSGKENSRRHQLIPRNPKYTSIAYRHMGGRTEGGTEIVLLAVKWWEYEK